MENEEYECEDFMEHCCDCYEYGEDKFYITTKGGRKIWTCLDFARELHNQGEIECHEPCRIDYWNCERTNLILKLMGNQPLFRIRYPKDFVSFIPILCKCVSYSQNAITVSPNSGPDFTLNSGGTYVFSGVENSRIQELATGFYDVLKLFPSSNQATLMLGCKLERRSGEQIAVLPSQHCLSWKSEVTKEEVEYFARGVKIL